MESPYDNNSKELIATKDSFHDGEFSFELNSGVYEIVFSKEEFEEVKKVIMLDGDTVIGVSLASTKKIEKKVPILSKTCTSKNCHNFTIYFIEPDESGCPKRIGETFTVADGSVVDLNTVVDNFGISRHSNDLEVSIGGMNVPLEFYYKGTKEKYDWSKPVYEDVEIELGGISDIFNNELFQYINGCHE